MKKGTLPVVEAFATFQGEGLHTGRRAYFVRLYGCDLKCAFCDSAATWHPDWKPVVDLATPEELVSRALRHVPVPDESSFVVITGGEPTLYDLSPVAHAFHLAGFRVHLETAGHHRAAPEIDWVTLSPKPRAGRDPLPEMVARADEFKVIVEDAESIIEALRTLRGRRDDAPVWLHPEWSRRTDEDVLSAICEAVQTDSRFRAGYQMHKLYRADSRAEGALRTLVPLGGDPRKGF